MGEFIGRNTQLLELRFASFVGSMFSSETRYYDDNAMTQGCDSGPDFPSLPSFQAFCKGLSNNRSAKKVDFHDPPRVLGEFAMTSKMALAASI